MNKKEIKKELLGKLNEQRDIANEKHNALLKQAKPLRKQADELRKQIDRLEKQADKLEEKEDAFNEKAEEFEDEKVYEMVSKQEDIEADIISEYLPRLTKYEVGEKYLIKNHPCYLESVKTKSGDYYWRDKHYDYLQDKDLYLNYMFCRINGSGKKSHDRFEILKITDINKLKREGNFRKIDKDEKLKGVPKVVHIQSIKNVGERLWFVISKTGRFFVFNASINDDALNRKDCTYRIRKPHVWSNKIVVSRQQFSGEYYDISGSLTNISELRNESELVEYLL